jgi:type III secretion protein J
MRRLLLGLLLCAGCSVPVQHGLEEGAANEVVTALERAGIGAEKTREEGSGLGAAGFVIRVARGDASRAMELLRSLGLPRSRRSGLAEMYGQPSLVPTATEERARFLEALGSEIERTLETIEGIVNARVHLVLAETDPLSPDGKPRVPAQAAVLLKTRAAGVPPVKEGEVQKLVAGSVPGLEPAAVAVVVTSAPEWSGSSKPTLTALGPLRVTPGSRPLLLGAFAFLLGLVAALALALLLTARRLAAAQRTQDDRAADGPASTPKF